MASVSAPRALCRLAGRVRPALSRPDLTRSLSGVTATQIQRPSVRSGTALLRVPRTGLATRSGPRATASQPLSDPVSAPSADAASVGSLDVAIDAADLVATDEAGRCLRVQWRDGSESLYPFVWLRDNCQCSACFLGHPTFVRSLVLRDLDVNTSVEACRVTSDGSELSVTWSDGHQGTYAAEWLLLRSFRPEERRRRREEHSVEKSHWNASQMSGKLPKADFQQVLDSEPARLALLLALERYGLVVLQNCGSESGQVLKLIQAIGYPHTTHYGTTFKVTTKADPINIAYTTKRLNMHADLPYYEQQPQVQLLHYQRQHGGGGGRSEFADALHVAAELRRLQPEAYRVLADTPVDWVNVTLPGETGRSHHKLYRAPVLQEDAEGRLVGLRFSQAQRDSFFGVPLGVVDRWYRAFALFNRMLNDEEYKVSFLPQQGDMVMFDNTRLTHGREDFEWPEQATQRCLEGGYIGLDDIRDHRRTLQHRLGRNEFGL
ncbi:gamma-butyrobetaine dioxygenase-like [Amphibalanus amphitrite]|uniref:gamma-butyrobetaine dioxygenase-like n=1 Tax=Amphibalanus amphitrite TaxID=1232801 RepID=UPI001C924D4E|nr:gamma-butyrobetaine dioxygenase-like [Amphibalanus amphitrite]